MLYYVKIMTLSVSGEHEPVLRAREGNAATYSLVPEICSNA